MLKKIILASFATILLSCSRDSEDVVTTDTTPILPTKITETYDDGGVTTYTFRYNGDKIIDITSSDGEKIEYTYNGDDIVKEIAYDNGVVKEANEYFYSNGKLISQNVKNNFSSLPLNYTINYNYITDNYVQFSRITGYSTDSSSNITYFYTLYDVYLTSNGNLTKVVATQKNGSVTGPTTGISTYTCNYDDKNNPFKNIKGFIKTQNLNYTDRIVALNNLVKSTGTHTSNNNSSNTSTNVITYNYNNNNFPIKSIIVQTSSFFPTNSYTSVFEYNK